mmetsp:Transcript_56550/g.177601  ORF Transcript_56550/g.177601 Transcript_56550/m.177601 type:complete len:219 (-) Transcript_56550:21-677(-)
MSRGHAWRGRVASTRRAADVVAAAVRGPRRGRGLQVRCRRRPAGDAEATAHRRPRTRWRCVPQRAVRSPLVVPLAPPHVPVSQGGIHVFAGVGLGGLSPSQGLCEGLALRGAPSSIPGLAAGGARRLHGHAAADPARQLRAAGTVGGVVGMEARAVQGHVAHGPRKLLAGTPSRLRNVPLRLRVLLVQGPGRPVRRHGRPHVGRRGGPAPGSLPACLP